MQTKKHCTPISKALPVAQTGFDVKIQFIEDVISRVLIIQRQAPWKAAL